MDSIKIQEKYEFFLKTLNEFGLHLLNERDDEIGYWIFEEFYGDAISFLHENNLNCLLESNYINKDIYSMSLELRKKFLLLENSVHWNLKLVRTDKEWLSILKLSDEIKKLISNFCNKI